jgi:phenylacetate-CoA ligase
MVAAPHLSDDERFPLLSEDRRGLLKRLREHVAAPRYNMACGDRLREDSLERVRAYETTVTTNSPRWRAGQPPEWVIEFAKRCRADVPFYRKRDSRAEVDAFDSIPTTSRSDIAREPWSFVPDSAPLDDLIVYYTSGASGSPMNVLAHPEFAAKRLPLFRAALARHGVKLEGGADRVSILFACSQQFTLTYASLSTYLDGAGHVKINLHPAEWRDPDDRIRFIEDCDAEICTGDPLSFLDLAALPLKWRPKAMISSAMRLQPRVKEQLEGHFGCPVIDLYSTCESGPIAVASGDGFEVLPPDLYVEVVDSDGRPCAPGVRGEVTLTGGRNPFLPLLRYRTGDWAAMTYDDDVPRLVEMEGRAPVVFVATDGWLINNIDVTTVLRPFALSQFAVHQHSSGALTLRLRELTQQEAIASALRRLFGSDQRIDFELISPEEWKVIPFSRES